MPIDRAGLCIQARETSQLVCSPHADLSLRRTPFPDFTRFANYLPFLVAIVDSLIIEGRPIR